MKEEARTAEVELALEPDASAVQRALRALGELEGSLSAEEMEDTRLLVGELVTNAVLHAGLGPGDEIRLRVTVSPDEVRGEVRDPGPGFDAYYGPRSRPPTDETSGRGLFIVDRVSKCWGAERQNGLNRVWFELGRHGGSRAETAGPPPRQSTGLVGSFSASVREEEEEGGALVVVEARGEADLAAYDALLGAVEEAAERAGEPPRPIVVDLKGVTYLDSLGLGVLVGGTAGLRDRGGEVHVVAQKGPCLHVLRIAGLERVVRVHADLPSALRGAVGWG